MAPRAAGGGLGRLEARAALPRALLRLAARRPRTVLALWVLVAAAATPAVLRLDIQTSTDSVLDRSGPEWAFYQESQAQFGGDEILTLVLESRVPFDRELLREVAELSASLAGIPGVRRVDSLATVPLVRSTPEGDVSLDAALAGGVPEDAEALQRLAGLVQADRIARRNLVSENARALAVNLVLEQGPEAHYDAILAEVERALSAGDGDGRPAWLSGVPIFRTATDSRTRSELLVFVPLTVAVVGLLLLVLFGSLRAVWIPLAASGLGTWCVLGAMGASDTPLTISTAILPSVLLALGCAYAMHMLCAAAGASDPQAIEARLEGVALPIALSGLTTAVGFVAVSFVRIEVIRDVGAFGALGVLIVLAATLTAAPAALRLWPLPARRWAAGWLGPMGARRLVAATRARSRAVIAAWLLLLVPVAYGISRVDVETDVILWFTPDDPIRQSYQAIRERLSGISPINLVIRAADGGSVAAPEVVRAVDGLAAHLESLEGVGRAVSVADPLRQLHGGFTGDGARPLPDDADLIAQYLLLLESTEYLGDLITPDRSAANVVLRANDNGSGALRAIAASGEAWWREHGPPGTSARATGIMYEFARAEDEIAFGQLRGLGFALLAVAGILLAIFRWARLAAVALLPNALPVAVAFGAMGLLGIALDAGTVFVGSLALGIAVDDTVHTVAGFYRQLELGDCPERALEVALGRVLPPLVYTTLAVALGFLVLGVSEFTFTRHLGLLTAAIMLLCLLADLLLLPALLLRAGPLPVAEAPALAAHAGNRT